VSIQGSMKAELYERDGETKFSLTVFADAILALKQPPNGGPSDMPPGGWPASSPQAAAASPWAHLTWTGK
jgi:hypothetical protein